MQLKLDDSELTTLRKLCELVVKYEDTDWRAQTRYLFERFFNPAARRKNLYENVKSLPYQQDFDTLALERLERKGLVEYLFNKEHVIPKPLGILVVRFGEQIPEYALMSLIEQYHERMRYKLKSAIKHFGKVNKLPLSQLAPIVFLLYNNNTSEQQGHFERDSELKESIDRIVHAFASQNPDSRGTKERDGALSGWYLTEANRKLGLPIYNKEPVYYIKPGRIDDVEISIRESIKEYPKKARASFDAFEKAFARESKTLFEKGGLYSTIHSKQKVKKIFLEVFG